MCSSKLLLFTTALRRVVICLLPFVAFSLCGCGEKTSPAAAPSGHAAGAGPAPEVGYIVAEPVSVPLRRDLPGYVKPVRVAQVRARVAGILQKQVFREGADVKEGELLFEIDPNIFQVRVESARASVAQAEANIARATANATQAGQQAKRYRELAPSKAVSQQELDNAIAADLQAQAELKAAEAALKAASAALSAAEIDLGYTKVTAPISGRIGRPLVTEGALVGQGEATLLAEINQLDTIYVDFTQAANELSSFKQNAAANTDWNKAVKVVLLLDNGTEYKVPGKPLLSEISVDSSTSSVTLRVEFSNADWILWPGMYVWGRFEYDDGSKAFLIPQQAVMRNGKSAAVYVIGADNKVVLLPLASSEVRGSNQVVRGNGLKAGDKIVVEGAQKAIPLPPGTVVKSVPWNAVRPQSAAPVAPAK
ncbi:MAG: efflux RND transporter periplasmic adaptor subunit [Puniceicoccales bacterium]|jgi:membrane fusion protein (multidrug efflux system)|nr:efflux RND transporter periplasmic adaptor subunit [Puniceicoccales bacterium]